MSEATYIPWDSAEILDSEETILEYLRAALEGDDRDSAANPSRTAKLVQSPLR